MAGNGRRDFDVVVFGATGVTARQVARYLTERSKETGARWAAAARDRAKLERVLEEVGANPPDIITADVTDEPSLRAMASRTRVVLNGVGPYALYARPVIEACIDAGTHYADLTGEIPFVRRIIDELDDRAKTNGAKVVQVCGFESLPADLGVLLAAEGAREHGERLAECELFALIDETPGLIRPSDLSGGTLQSMATMLADPDAGTLNDAASLVPDESVATKIRGFGPISARVRRRGGDVLAPMVPAAFINPPVIQRTAWLTGHPPFPYREGIVMAGRPASLPLRYVAAGALSGFQTLMARLARARPPTRERVSRVLGRLFPSSGFGPRPERLEAWRWRLTIEARTSAGRDIAVEVEGEGNPGYCTSARMLGEAGLLLAQDGATPERAGCLTPAAALGTARIGDFANARLRFRRTT